MPAALTIPKRRSLASALDHEALFGLALERVRQLAHATWTDHNIHDPGITILELLCYALTDLGYRASYSVPDLLATADDNAANMRAQFCTARDILPNRALTTGDYRKLLIDLKGVKNAWLSPATETYYADTIIGELVRDRPADMSGVVQVDLRGLYDVLIEFMDDVTTAAERTRILRDARARLHANRNLCEDFVNLAEVATQPFVLCAEVELSADADIARVHADVLFQVQQYLAPPVLHYTLDEMLARTKPDGSLLGAEEIFDGPVLDHGFIPDDELARAELRTEIRLSDVVSIVMDVPGVRAVRDIVMSPAGSSGAVEQKWVLPVEPGRKPLLDNAACRLVFHKRNMPFVARTADVTAHLDRLAAAATARVETAAQYDLPIPLGEFRDPGAYTSFQNHFPAIYGLGEAGIVGGGGEHRQVLAYQLKAYLLFFDQIMADFAAQLAHVSDLFSLDAALLRTYFHQPVSALVDADSIYATTDVAGAIESTIDDATVQVDRRNRFLDHLIARYGERFHEFAGIMRSEFNAPAAGMVSYRTAFLRDYPLTSSGRATAYDYTQQADDALWSSDNISGLERRLARLLGIRDSRRRNLGDVAYDIYAEIDNTPDDEFRFRIRRRDSRKIVLSSSRNYVTQEDARAEMRRAIDAASMPEGYERKQGADGRHYFNIIDDTGDVLARRIEYFETDAEMETAIAELIDYMREHYSDEGMYVIENILLRPESPADPFLPICPDPNCTDCADEDPYSYRIHIILPAYGSRFSDMDFRRWAEQVIREETPAHILPKICWVSADDMAALESLYRDWLYLKSGRQTAQRDVKLTTFILELFAAKSVYPTQKLNECGAGETHDRFVLGRTALGTMD